MLRAGDLKHFIIIEQVTETRSASGSITEAWSKFAEAFADIRPLSSREFVEGGADKSDVTHRVYIRALSGIRSKMRFSFDDRTFEIAGPPLDAREAGDLMTLLAREINP